MIPISRSEALRLCATRAVLVEFTNQGCKSLQPLTSRSPFYVGSGRFNYQSLRYYLVRSAMPSRGTATSVQRKKPTNGSPDGPEPLEAQRMPREVNEENEIFSVRIMAENGKDAAANEILPGASLKLKAVTNKGAGSYTWRTSSTVLKLENTGSQVVTVKVDAGSQLSGKSETLELIFTPTGSPPLGPVNHSISVVRVVFSVHKDHPWGYDEAGELVCEDLNGSLFNFKTDSTLDRISVEKGKTGMVNVYYEGVAGRKLFFKAKDASMYNLVVENQSTNPIVLRIEAKDCTFKESGIEARVGGLSGPVVAEIDVTVMKPVQYEATYYRIIDPSSPKTKLTTKASPKEIQHALNRLYHPAVAWWKIHGTARDIECRYDSLKNGVLNLEPGLHSAELEKIKTALGIKGGIPLVHVHELSWTYFLAKDAGRWDSKITLKKYGSYLDFIGNIRYKLEDATGKVVFITVKSVDNTTGELELSAPLGFDLKVSDKAALIWPLGGLSGNPTLISDAGNLNELIIYAAHELGHTYAKFEDIAEVDNVMFGGGSLGEGLRGRALPLFYHPERKESQWGKMPGRK
ncbi:MAG: hypothetical protein JWO30_320 [Fibrobacteres bacterium]|nr:hypothetical protein [Fibrobacterota bacterium]